MDQTRLEAAEDAYRAAEWSIAAREYLGATEGEIEGSGYAFHRAGNALLKLRRFEDAVAVYDRAVQDPEYRETGAVLTNLGTALAALGRHDKALAAFRRALDEPRPGQRYRALQGLASSAFELRHFDEAAEAYRQAALDSANPDPGKALNNLGLTFMALDRAGDAVEAYRAAIDLPTYKGRGRSSANLGMAYTALGMHERAVAAYERARDEFDHQLSAQHQAAYEASIKALGGAASDSAWRTAEMPPLVRRSRYDFDDDEEDMSPFFTRTDAEMREVDRQARLDERNGRHPERPRWVGIVVGVAVAVVVIGALFGAYLAGIGYPTQQMTVNGLLEAHLDGDDVARYWVAVPAADMDLAMAALPAGWASYTVGAVERSARTSAVMVTITLEQGGSVAYQLSLAREGFGWKVNGVTTSFTSLDEGV